MTSATDRMVELHGEHARALWAFALRLVGGDRARAEDVVQETLLRAWRDRVILESTSAGARAWLFTVARRLVIDEWRSSRANREVLTDEAPEPTSSAIVNSHQVSTVGVRPSRTRHSSAASSVATPALSSRWRETMKPLSVNSGWGSIEMMSPTSTPSARVSALLAVRASIRSSTCRQSTG